MPINRAAGFAPANVNLSTVFAPGWQAGFS